MTDDHEAGTPTSPPASGPTPTLSQHALASLRGPVATPGYARDRLVPSIVHIGVGGFHRAHLATYVDQLCRSGHTAWSIIGAGVMPHDVHMAEVLTAQDGLYTLLVRDVDGVDARVIGSITGYVLAHPDPTALIDRIAAPETAIISLTVTEGGYPVDDETGVFDPTSPNARPGSTFDLIVRGLARRRAQARGPVTVLSCDNVIGNGTVARTSTMGLAGDDAALAAWIGQHVSFPNSMVDRITPATSDADRAFVADELGYVDAWPVATEPFIQWVVEDRFAGPRLPLEELDVIVTDDVEPYELFKLRLLNAGHSCLAYLARVAGIELVDQVMARPRFATFLRRFLDTEAGPVVPEAPGIDLESYTRSLVDRFSNPAIGDQVDRLCLDGSSKFPKFLLPTVRAQLAADGPVGLSALALAGWCRYLQGTQDDGAPISHAADPRLAEAVELARAAGHQPAAFLGFTAVFGTDLPADPRFASAFGDALDQLATKGVAATLDEVLGLA